MGCDYGGPRGTVANVDSSQSSRFEVKMRSPMKAVLLTLLLAPATVLANPCAQFYLATTAQYPDHNESWSGYVTGLNDTGIFTSWTRVSDNVTVTIQDSHITTEMIYPLSHCEMVIDYNADAIFTGKFE
jgi:hypothetical protein